MAVSGVSSLAIQQSSDRSIEEAAQGLIHIRYEAMLPNATGAPRGGSSGDPLEGSGLILGRFWANYGPNSGSNLGRILVVSGVSSLGTGVLATVIGHRSKRETAIMIDSYKAQTLRQRGRCGAWKSE